MTKTLAILSPNQNAYSETFIQAHKNLPFNIKFYYGGYLPGALAASPDILKLSFSERIKRRLLRGFTFAEKRLMFSLRKEKVDCVLAEYGPAACESLKVIKYLKLPLIIHFHGYDAGMKSVLDAYKEKYKEAFNYSSTVIAVSKQMHQTLLELGCPADKLIINPYGPDDSFFSVVPDYSSQQFVFAGRFVHKKAPAFVIFSFKKVVEQFPEARLVMAGEGELLNNCKALAKLLGLEANITFKGVCTREEIRSLFQQSIAFVQHSVTADNGDAEGTPVAVLEAQASALPVISTFHAGIPDVVTNNSTGLLVEENDFEEMAKKMLRVLKEKGLAKKLGEAGRQRVKENFTMARHLGILEKAINESMTLSHGRF